MKLLIFTIFISCAFGQYFWQQYKPPFLYGGQNPYNVTPWNNFLNYPQVPPRNNASFWSPPFRGKRAVNYYQPYQYCIPDYTNFQCNGSHSVSTGCLSPIDKVLYRRNFFKTGSWFSRRIKDIDYPGPLPAGFVARNETITCIRIYDRYCNGTGGYAQILSGGGVGYKTAKIRLSSAGAFKGFHFDVAIYGR